MLYVEYSGALLHSFFEEWVVLFFTDAEGSGSE